MLVPEHLATEIVVGFFIWLLLFITQFSLKETGQ